MTNPDYPDREAFAASWADSVDLAQITCPLDDGHTRPGSRITDLSVLLPCKEVRNFVWTWPHDCIVRNDTLQMFVEAGLTGFEVKPVEAEFLRPSCKKRLAQLWEFVVTGWGGIAPPESGVRLLKECPGCGHLRYSAPSDTSKLIDLRQWDGSDFFMVWPLPKYLFVTQRAKDVIEGQGMTGVRFLRLEALEFEPGEGVSPGRLSNWMPERRARILGKPLGIY